VALAVGIVLVVVEAQVDTEQRQDLLYLQEAR
jgi:hypothetical protein